MAKSKGKKSKGSNRNNKKPKSKDNNNSNGGNNVQEVVNDTFAENSLDTESVEQPSELVIDEEAVSQLQSSEAETEVEVDEPQPSAKLAGEQLTTEEVEQFEPQVEQPVEESNFDHEEADETIAHATETPIPEEIQQDPSPIVENPFDDSNAVQPWDNTAEEDILPAEKYQYKQQNNGYHYDVECGNAYEEEPVQQYEEPTHQYEEPFQQYEEPTRQYEETVQQYEQPVQEYEQHQQQYQEPIKEPVGEPVEEPVGDPVEEPVKEPVEEPVPESDVSFAAVELTKESRDANVSLQWENNAVNDLMPWEQPQPQHVEQPFNGFADGDLLSSSPVAEDAEIIPTESANDVHQVVEELPVVESENVTEPVEEESILWDNSTADDSNFPWSTKNKSNNFNTNDQDTSELIINDNLNAETKDDEDFLNSLAAAATNISDTSGVNNTFGFLNKEANLSANDHIVETKHELFTKPVTNVAPSQPEPELENKFDFLEDDDDMLLEDVMDEDFLDDDEEDEARDSFDVGHMNNIDEMLANDSFNNTVVISKERRSSKYQPLQLIPRPPPKSMAPPSRSVSNIPIPDLSNHQTQTTAQIPRSPPPNFANPTNKLASVLQKEKQKSDAYDFPQELFSKNKPKPLATQSIYTEIEKNAIKPVHPVQPSQPAQPIPPVHPLGIQANSTTFAQPPQNPVYERSSSVTSTKSTSFFTELPIPNTERKGSLHLKNPYGKTEGNQHTSSVSSTAPPPKKSNAYMPAVTPPNLEPANLNKSLSSATSKFVPANLPPPVKKVSNPYAPQPQGGHIRQISTTVTNPDDIKPNLVPVPVKIGLNSPITPTDTSSRQNASGGRYTPLTQQSQYKYPQQQQQQQQPQSQYQLQQSQYQPQQTPQQQPQSQQPQPQQQQQPPNSPYQPAPTAGKYQPNAGFPQFRYPQHQSEQNGRSGNAPKNKGPSSRAHKAGNSINDLYGPPPTQTNHIPSDARRGTILPPSSSKYKTTAHVGPAPAGPAPIVINPENLVRIQWPLFSFSGQDKVASMIPTFDGYNHNICNINVTDISNILIKDELVSSFPGPLIKNKSKRKDVIKWLDDKVNSLENAPRAPSLVEQLTWKCLKLMLQKIDKPGDFLDKEYIKEICSILNPDLNVATAMNNSFDIIELTKLSKTANPNKTFNATSLDSAGFEYIHGMLEVGDKKSALEFAVAQGDWAMALLVSNLMGPLAFNQITKLYTVVHFAGDAIGQDLSFFVQSKAEGGFSIDQLKGKDAWLVENFKIVVPFIMMGNPDYGKILMQIGESLNKAGQKAYGHLACILSGLPLIPQFLSQMPSSIYGIIIEEIYAYILLSSGNIPQTFSNGFPHLIPLQIRHAGYLADIGCATDAKRYCDFTQSLISSKQLFCEPATVISQKDLCERLSQIGNSWITSKLSRPQLDKVWNTLDKSFNKFVAGEDVPQPEQKTDGVFSKFSSPALMSRPASTLDLADIKAQASRRSTGGIYSNQNNYDPHGSGVNTPRMFNPPPHLQENAMLRDNSNDTVYPFPVSVTPVHQSQGKYAPTHNNFSSDSLYTIPMHGITVQNTPQQDDNTRRNSLFNQLPPPHAHIKPAYQHSPKLPSARLVNDSNVLTPLGFGVKSPSSSPAANRINPYNPSPLDNSLSRTSTRSAKDVSPAPAAAAKLSPLVGRSKLNTPLDNDPAVKYDYNATPIAEEHRGSPLRTLTSSVPPPPPKSETPPRLPHAHKFEDSKPHYALEIDPTVIQTSIVDAPVVNVAKHEQEGDVLTSNDDADYENDIPLSESTHVHQPDELIVAHPHPHHHHHNHPHNNMYTPVVNHAKVSNVPQIAVPEDASIRNETVVSDIPTTNETVSEVTVGQILSPVSPPSVHAQVVKPEVIPVAKPDVAPIVKDEPANVEASKPPASASAPALPSIPAYKLNPSRLTSRNINRYGPPGSTPSVKKPRNPYASQAYSPAKPASSNYAPSTESTDVTNDDVSNDTGIPEGYDMFSYGGYSVPPPTEPIVETPVEEVSPVFEASVVEKKSEVKDEIVQDDIPTFNSIPTFKPPTQLGVPNRTQQFSQQHEMKLPDMFTPPTPIGNDTARRNSTINSPIHHTTEEKRYVAEETGDYYDDVIDDSDDEEDKKKSEAARIKAEKEEAERKKKAEKEEADRKKKEENEKKRRESKGDGWFGWLGKGKQDDKPKPIKAKLGEENSFYYDEKLKRWINKKQSLDEQLEASKPPPPPKMMMKRPVSPLSRDDSPISRSGSVSGPPHISSPLTAPPTTSRDLPPPSTLGSAPPAVKKKDSIDDLLSMKPPAGGKKTTRRAPRRGYVDVMAQNGMS